MSSHNWICPKCENVNDLGSGFDGCDPHEFNHWCENKGCSQGVILWITENNATIKNVL